MRVVRPLTLSEYMLDRFSSRSEIASLLLRTIMSSPISRKYRMSVPFRGQLQNLQETEQHWDVPWSFANDTKFSHIGMLMARSNTFPRIGKPFGPGGYGRMGFFRLPVRTRIEMKSSSR